MQTRARNRARGPKRPAAKGSGEDDLGWIWGRHAALAALANPERRIVRALATRNALKDVPEGVRDRVELVEPKTIDAALPPSAVHQGFAVHCAELAPVALARLATPAEGVVIVLDQVTDPQNAGAILRTGVAFGARGLVMQDRKAPPLMGAAAKAAVGAAERLAHARVVNISRAVEELRAAGWTAIGLAGEAEATLEEALATANRGVALVLGAEGKGLRPSVAEACDVLARIPISDAVESLNVSAAAAIALYAANARRTEK